MAHPKEFAEGLSIGIIMDGNGRWAKNRGLPRTAGHKRGAEVFSDIADYCDELGVSSVYFYAFSTENWKRPLEEVNAIMRLFGEYLLKGFDYKNRNIRIKFMGDRTVLDEKLQQLMNKLEADSSVKTGMTLNIAINYGGRPEIVRAAQQLAAKAAAGEIKPEEITEQLLSDAMYTAGQKDPDFILRPSGEKRLSNFMLWQAAYSELVEMDVLWPDFTRSDLDAAITIPTGATVTNTGCSKNTVVGNGASQNLKLDLTSNTILTVTYGDYSRNYYIVATDANTISVKVGIDFTEALDSEAYKTKTDVKNRVDKLIGQCKIFFGNKGVETTDTEKLAELPTHGEITVPAGTTAMGIMRMFAVKYEYGSEVPENCTYMAKLNGVGEFTFGNYSGWMYSDNPTWDTETGEALYTTWRTPAVGGADYVLTQNSNICWFICCNYMHHPWQ